MNNIFVSQPDPLLQNSPIPQQQYYQIPVPEYPIRDWVGELDEIVRGLSEYDIKALSENDDYNNLSNILQQAIQVEIMALVKSKLNINPDIINNVRNQMEIIKTVKDKADEEQRKNISELNDYVKNYSHLTFDEYKKIKETHEG